MKRFALALLIIIGCVVPNYTFAAESIKAFDVIATINRGDDFFLTEQISYDFADLEKHGIYRYIPRYMIIGRRKIDLGQHWLGVLRDGASDQASVQTESEHTLIKIGDPNKTISGRHEYRINYSIARAIVDAEGGQRLAWNVTGDGWQVPISASSMVIDGPVAPTSVTCYTGALGEKGRNCEISSSGTKILAKMTRPLAPREGWTIEATYPHGTFVSAAVEQTSRFPWLAPWMVFVFVYSLACILLWAYFGRDPKGRGVIIAEFEPPTGWKPYEVNALLNDGANHRAIAATILDLTRRGVIKLTTKDEGRDYDLERQPQMEKNLDTVETNVIEMLFAMGASYIPTGAEAKRGKLYQSIHSTIEKELVKKGLYQHGVTLVRWLTGAIVIVTWLACLYVLDTYLYDPHLILSVIGLLVGLICAYYMPKRTPKGAIVREHVLGFKNYIQVAEKDRLAFHEGPARTPERFSALLPFAAALGVEKQWGKLFEDIKFPANEASGSSSAFYAMRMGVMAHQINNDMRSLVITSTSSGGGGGSSGGGGGGGGGGSW